MADDTATVTENTTTTTDQPVSKRPLVYVVALGIGLLVAVLLIAFDNDDEPSFSVQDERNYRICADEAKKQRIDPTSDAGQLAVGRCMQLLGSE